MKKIMVLLVMGLVLILVNWVGVILIRHGIPFTDKAPQEAHEAVSTIANNIPDNSRQIDQVPQSIQEIKETIAKGNPDDSAHALTKLVPDGNALLKHYDELIQIAESTTGVMNPEILKAARVGTHGFNIVSQDKTRTAAILQWISLKSWDVKNPLDKQHLLDRFAAAAQRLITSGKLPAISGLECVLRSVSSEMVNPDPQVSLHAVVTLFEGQVPNADKALRDYLWASLNGLGKLLPEDEMNQLFAFFKQHYIEKNLPLTYRDQFFPDMRYMNIGPGPISWKEYEEIVEGPLYKIYGSLCMEQCREECSGSYYCNLAGWRIIEEYARNPSEVTDLVESLLKDGLMVRDLFMHIDIAKSLRGVSPNDNGSVMPIPLVISILKSAGRNHSALSSDSLSVVNSKITICLDALSQRDVDKSKELAELQATCINVQKRLRAEMARRSSSWKLPSYLDFFSN